MPSNRITAWWRYNPIIQKPISLDPVKPWSWFYYYGPDPAAGVSYGAYVDDESEVGIITEAREVVYSPVSSKPMKKVKDLSYDKVSAMLSKAESSAMKKFVCTSCKQTLIAGRDPGQQLPLSPCHGVDVQVEDKAQENQTMATKNAGSTKLKAKIRANIIRERRRKAAAARAKSETEAKTEDLERKKRIEARRQAKAAAIAKAKAKRAEYVSLDQIVKAMEDIDDDSMDDVVGKDKLDAAPEGILEDESGHIADNKVEEAMEDEEDMVSLDELQEAMEDLEDDMEMMEGEDDMEFMEDEGLEEEPAEAMEEDEEEEPAEAMDDEEEEDFVDLDVMLSMLKKKEANAKAKASAKPKKVKAEEAPAIEEAPKVDEKVEEPAPAKEAAEDSEEEEYSDPNPHEDPEPDMVDEENPIPGDAAPKEDMEAMRFEPLASVASLEKAGREEIDLALYGEDTKNPVWNVTVAGVPVAQIALANQSCPEEIRQIFCSEAYAEDLIEHCEKTGFQETMKRVNATYWANHIAQSAVANHFEGKYKAAFEAEKRKLLASYKEDFMNCLEIVTAGMNKNFYPDAGHPLKDHLFTNIELVGVPEQTAISAVEKSFAEGSSQYFQTLFEKAQEYMEMSPEARNEISKAIASSSSLNHVGDRQDVAPATLSNRLSQASVVPETYAPIRVESQVSMASDDFKSQLRNSWRR